MSANDINEIYSIFNSMIKHSFDVSLMACSRTSVLTSLPDADIALKVVDIMGYVESRRDIRQADLKEKIKAVYQMLPI
jgi:hypothetical protein